MKQKALPKETKQTTPSIDSSLEKLISTANYVFEKLNEKSDIIRKLENSLRDIKAHFPFKLKVREEKSQIKYDLTDYHKQADPSAEGYTIETVWCLSWESDLNSKNYRLFLISEETEVVFHGSDEFEQIFKLPSRIVSKKPFIETDLPTRLKYSHGISSFINKFREDLETFLQYWEFLEEKSQ